MITITDSIDVKRWGEFVYNHPYGNIFQTPEMAEVYEKTKNYEPITLAAIDQESDEIIVILQASVIREIGGYLGSFSARSVIQGGPLFVEGDAGMSAVVALIGAHDKIVKKKVLYTQIRNTWDTSETIKFFDGTGYKYEDHLNFLSDLTIGVDGLWRQLYKSKRQGINKAMKNDVIVEEIEDKDQLQIFYELVRKSYQGSNIPLVDISLFESAFDVLTPKDMCKFFLAKYNNNYAAATCFLSYKGVIYDWYGGTDREFSKYRPNELLEWCTIKWGAENRHHLFDFGGAGKPGEPYGPREFKKEFGGRMVNYGRYEKIYSPAKMKLMGVGFEVYRKVII